MEIQSDQERTEKHVARMSARNHQNHGGLRSTNRCMNDDSNSLGTVIGWIVDCGR